MHAVLRFLLLGSTIALAYAGSLACTTSSSSGSSTYNPTLITLRPADFGGAVPCSKLPGAWKTWVATLIDVTDDGSPVTLASSYPVSCSMPVSFAFVIPGHRYYAEIEAYDRDDIVAYGPPASGSRHMIDPVTGEDVAPRWTARCPATSQVEPVEPTDADAGSGDAGSFDTNGAVAVLNMNVAFPTCTQLQEQLPGGPASILVNLSTVRTTQTCGAAAGQVERYVVTPQETALAPQDVACDSSASFEPVIANATYEFHVEAFEPGAAAAAWGTNCRAVAKAGLAIPATCDTLTGSGSVRIDIAALLQATGRSCSDGDVASYATTLVGGGSQPITNACTVDSTFGPLAAGTWQMVVDGLSADGDTLFTAFCEASVSPATIATATCSLR